jgi:hypothetical protein
MNFTAFAPAWVAAGLLAVLAVVVGLYLLRPPPVRVTVASTLIWQRVLGARRELSERWRWWLALLLSLLIALALAAAIAKPERKAVDGRAPDALAIVVDTAPTMAALRDDGRTRFAQALAEARARLAALDPTARVLIADTTRRIASLAWTTPSQAAPLLDGLVPAAGGEARMPALPPLPDQPDARPDLVLITDGVAPLALPPGTREVSVFTPAANVGITAFALRAPPADPLRWTAFVEVANAATRPARVRLEIAGAGSAPLVRELDVPARGYAQQSIAVAGFGGGPVRARVAAPDDAFAADDEAFGFLPFNRTLKVALVTNGNAALQRALQLDARVRLVVTTPAQFANRGADGVDAVVFDRTAPPTAPSVPALLWRPPKAAWLPAPGAAVTDPVADAWAVDERVLENVSLGDVTIDRATPWRAADLGDAARAVATTARGDALLIAQDAVPRRLAMAFAPDDSNFAQLASFPVFVSNALDWLTGEAAPLTAGVGPVVVPIAQAKVRGATVGAVDTRFVPGATLFTATQPDFFTADAPGGRVRVLVNPAGIAVTDIGASRFAQPGAVFERSGADAARGDGDAEAASRSPRAPWAWLLLVAAAAMLIEWFAYHRRVTA